MEYIYGQPISEELSQYLKKWTGKEDRITVNANTGIHPSTIRDLVYRNNTVTENNCIAITELMKLAIQNCQNKKESAEEAEDYFNDMLDTEKKTA